MANHDPIRTRVDYTLNDFMDARATRRVRLPMPAVVMFLILPVVMVFCLLWNMIQGVDPAAFRFSLSSSISDLCVRIINCFILMMPILVVLSMPLFIWWVARRTLLRTHLRWLDAMASGGSVDFLFSAAGVERSNAIENAVYSWEAFTHLVMCQSVMVLILAKPVVRIIVPLRGLSAEQVDTIKAWFHVKPPAKLPALPDADASKPDQIHIHSTMSWRDFRLLNWLHPRTAKSHRFMVVAGLLMAAYGGWSCYQWAYYFWQLQFYPPATPHEPWWAVMPSVFIFLVGVEVLVYRHTLMGYIWGRIRQVYGMPTDTLITNEQVTTRTQYVWIARRWSTFHQAVIDRRAIILTMTSNETLVIPRHDVDAVTYERIGRLVRKYIPMRTSGFPVQPPGVHSIPPVQPSKPQ